MTELLYFFLGVLIGGIIGYMNAANKVLDLRIQLNELRIDLLSK